MKPHYPFIASKNYKGGDLSGLYVTPQLVAVFIQCQTDPWSYQVDILVLSMVLTADKTWDQMLYTAGF